MARFPACSSWWMIAVSSCLLFLWNFCQILFCVHCIVTVFIYVGLLVVYCFSEKELNSNPVVWLLPVFYAAYFFGVKILLILEVLDSAVYFI